MKVAVIGAGYLGTTHAAGMAQLGHDVVAVDIGDREPSVGFRSSTYVLPRVVTDWVVGDRDIRDIDVPILLCAARMWERCASAYDRERRAERKVRHTIMVGRAA